MQKVWPGPNLELTWIPLHALEAVLQIHERLL